MDLETLIDYTQSMLQSLTPIQYLVIVGITILLFISQKFTFQSKRKRRKKYYRNTYLNSSNWKKKRKAVLQRDNYRCVYCPNKATEVHHLRYAKKIGTEPTKWLVSICRPCHNKAHNK